MTDDDPTTDDDCTQAIKTLRRWNGGAEPYYADVLPVARVISAARERERERLFTKAEAVASLASRHDALVIRSLVTKLKERL